MDDRLKRYKIGLPVPESDIKRRLYIGKYVAPIAMDFATTFRINSTFMDVTDQPYLRRQITSTVACLSICGVIFSVYFWFLPDIINDPGMGAVYTFLKVIALISISAFGGMAIWCGRDELFSLTRRPVRFNRRSKKIYAVRRRRFFSKYKDGDVVWEIPWSKETVFCVSKNNDSWGGYYHIVCYKVDDDGNVARALAIGRRWELHELEVLLAQWNYWCMYMNDGPEKLPKPMLYLAENESVVESFFICMYTFGFAMPAFMKIIGMPFILPIFICRRLSLATCRDPRWPDELTQINQIPGEGINEPKGATPVGWKATIEARHRGDWPNNPHVKTPGWYEEDAQKNARNWAET